MPWLDLPWRCYAELIIAAARLRITVAGLGHALPWQRRAMLDCAFAGLSDTRLNFAQL
jgi:hypothetical protein